MVANPMRSYDIRAELVIGENATLSDPHQPFPPESRNTAPGFTRRTGTWALHEQTYYFDQPMDQTIKPEYAGLYSADDGTSSPLDDLSFQ